MLILTSNGLSSEKLLKGASNYIKSGKAALVVTADNEYKEKDYHVERLTKSFKVLVYRWNVLILINDRPMN